MRIERLYIKNMHDKGIDTELRRVGESEPEKLRMTSETGGESEWTLTR